MHSFLPVGALLFNALVWGVSWWPFRFLYARGLHPLWATALMYVLAVAVLLVLLGGTIGLGIAALLVPAVTAASGGMIQLPGVMPETWLMGLLLMLAIGVIVGLLPALRGMRLNIVDALAGR